MLLPILIYSIPCLILYTLVRNYNSLPRTIPGALLARFTNLHRLLSVLLSSPHQDQLDLHNHHGPFVRLGPAMVSVQGPAYVSQIYGIGKGFIKSDFYSVFQNIVNGRRTASLVAMTDESDHARTKRVIAHAYSLSTLVEFETLVDSTVRVFLDDLASRYANRDKICDFGTALQYFAFDVIGELTFSKRLGFIERSEDVDGIITAIGANFRYFSVLGQMPWLDDLLGKNPIYVKYFRSPVSSPILNFAQKLLQERLDTIEKGEEVTTNENEPKPSKPDFLSRFLAARTETDSPDLTTDAKLLSYLFMNINAGSDTIASTLKAIFYYLLTNPSSLAALHKELSTASSAGKLSTPCPTYAETQSLSYLQAVIKESLRLNPALSLPLERIVPAGGLTLSSPAANSQPLHIPAGSIVGINPYVQHRHTPTFDPDSQYPVEAFHPERWLSEQEKETKSMEHALLTFGAGKRSCLGKNIAMLELSKVVPALLMRFEMEFVGQEGGWRVENKWVLDQKGLMVRVRERKPEKEKV